MTVKDGIPFNRLPEPLAEEEVSVRQTYVIDRPRLLELLAPRYNWKPSMNRICTDAGLSGNRSSENWSESAVRAIADHHGIELTDFTTARDVRNPGRPVRASNRTCPKEIKIADDLREQIAKAAAMTGTRPAAWVETVLRACVTFTIGKEGVEK